MGCDIHAFVETRVGGVWTLHRTLDWDRNYAMFGVLAGVRNYSETPPIAEPKGMPDIYSRGVDDQLEYWDSDAHNHSWFTLAELLQFDWDRPVEDRRVTGQTGPNSWNGGVTAEPGGGTMTTYREQVGQQFWTVVNALAASGVDPNEIRIVFWFGN